jgi:hypothetical protein
MSDGLIGPSYCLYSHAEQSTAYVQPKEMPFCLARLMTICVLDAGDKVEMQDEDGVSG